MSESTAPLNPPRRLLMGPGPVMVEPRVYEAMTQPIVSHVDPFFYQVFEDIRKLLGPVFGTRNQFRMVISGTGTAGMEASIVNFTERGTKFGYSLWEFRVFR